MNQPSFQNYNTEFWELVEQKYGTVRAFAEAMGISYPTAIKYLKDPAWVFGVKGPAFYKRMFDELGVSMCDAMAKFGMKTA